MMGVSSGLPMLMGSEKSASMTAARPRTVSETKQKERVWVPSPAIVMGSFLRACLTKLVTTRPSAGWIRGARVVGDLPKAGAWAALRLVGPQQAFEGRVGSFVRAR